MVGITKPRPKSVASRLDLNITRPNYLTLWRTDNGYVGSRYTYVCTMALYIDKNLQ
jgi:hypothetical protein